MSVSKTGKDDEPKKEEDGRLSAAFATSRPNFDSGRRETKTRGGQQGSAVETVMKSAFGTGRMNRLKDQQGSAIDAVPKSASKSGFGTGQRSRGTECCVRDKSKACDPQRCCEGRKSSSSKSSSDSLKNTKSKFLFVLILFNF